MAKTQVPVNVNSTGFTQIKTLTDCKTVIVRESNQAATTDYLVAAPLSSDGPASMPAGSSFLFVHSGPNTVFPAGTVVGFLKTVAGSVNFDVVET